MIQRILLSLCLIPVLTGLSGQSFEGIVKMIPSDPVLSEIVLSVQGQQSLIEVGDRSDPIRILNDKPNGQVLLLLNDFQGEKWAIRIDPEELFAMAEEEDGAGPLQIPLDLKQTGEVRQVGGYTCHKWTASTGEMDIEAWLTDEVPLYLPDLLPTGYEALIVDKNMRLVQQLAEKGFIMLYQASYRNGAAAYAFRMEVEEGPLPPGRFEPSLTDYQVYDLMDALEAAQEDPAKMAEVMELMRSLR